MKEKEYLISLITPVYNAIPYIEETFESVKNQTFGFENIEWLLVDDCSTDGSYELICRWSVEYPNIKVFRTSSNTGTPAEPRNIGLDHATAPFVMFLDNDDAFFSNACKALFDEIEQTGVDIVTGDVALLNPNEFSRSERKALLNYSDNIAMGKNDLVFPLDSIVEPFLYNHWSKIYRRSIIEQNHIRCLSGELWEDILFLFQYLTCTKTMSHIPIPIVKYRVRRESLSHVHSKRFYCSLPRSIQYGLLHTKTLSSEHARKYMALLTKGGHIESYVDCLLNDEQMTSSELVDCLLAWKPCFVASNEFKEKFHSAYCKILEDDFASDQDEKAVFHFSTLKELYKQRQTEINNILSSRTYRLAAKLAHAKTFLTGGEG